MFYLGLVLFMALFLWWAGTQPAFVMRYPFVNDVVSGTRSR